MEKSKEKVHFPSCLECMFAMQPAMRRICLGNSFTSPALETCPTVSLLQTSCFGVCCFLTLVLLPWFSASPVAWLSIRSLVFSHSHPNVQEYLYGQIRQEQNIKRLSLLMWNQTFLFTNTDEKVKRDFEGWEKTGMLSHIVSLSFQTVSRVVSVVRRGAGLLREACCSGHGQLSIC